MILAAAEEGCLHEVLVIAAALSVQDPRERPLDKQEAADARHALRTDPQSDFVGCLKLWDFYHKLKSELSGSQLRKACRQEFLSFNRMREWLDVHRELMDLAAQAGLAGRSGTPYLTDADQERTSGTSHLTNPSRGSGTEYLTDYDSDSISKSSVHRIKRGRTDRRQYDAVHRAILSGLLSASPCVATDMNTPWLAAARPTFGPAPASTIKSPNGSWRPNWSRLPAATCEPADKSIRAGSSASPRIR